MYNGLVDRLQIDFGQKPIRDLDMTEAIFKLLKRIPANVVALQGLRKILLEATTKIDGLIQNVDAVASAESPVRGEIRIPLNRAISMLTAISRILNDTNIFNLVVVLDCVTVSRLLSFWIAFLSKPITDSIAHMITNWSDDAEQDALVRFIPTITSFESLLTVTLFSGRTLSYNSKIVWGIKNFNSMEPLNLLKSINIYNRLVFAGRSWNADMRIINGSSALLAEITTNYKFKNIELICRTYRIKRTLQRLPTLNAKARCLWDEYFSLIWEEMSQSFQFEAVHPANKFKIICIRPENGRISGNVKTYAEAISHVWDMSRLDKSIQRETTIWQLPHILAYRELTNRASDKRDLDKELEVVALAYDIQYIHWHGDFEHFRGVRHGAPYFYKVVPDRLLRIAPSAVPNDMNEQNVGARLNEQTIQRVPFSRWEKVNLFRGLNTFHGSKRFQQIADSPELGFQTSGCKVRTKDNLRDLHKTLNKANQIHRDPLTGLWYFSEATIEECRGLQLDATEQIIIINEVPAVRQREEMVILISDNESIHDFVDNDLFWENESGYFRTDTVQVNEELPEEPYLTRLSPIEIDEQLPVSALDSQLITHPETAEIEAAITDADSSEHDSFFDCYMDSSSLSSFSTTRSLSEDVHEVAQR